MKWNAQKDTMFPTTNILFNFLFEQNKCHHLILLNVKNLLFILGLSALWRIIQSISGSVSQKDGGKKKNDSEEKKCPNNPHPHCKHYRPLPYYYLD